MNKVLGLSLITVELFGRFFLASFILTLLAIVGGLAVNGGAQMEMDFPDAFEFIGGYGYLHMMIELYIYLIVIIPLWIMVAFRERQVINEIKQFIYDRQEKKPIPKSWIYITIAMIIFLVGKILLEEFI